MRRLLFLYALLLWGSVVNAQIQRNFFGLEIGSATKQQVEETLKGMGKQYSSKTNEVNTHDIELEGYDWANVKFGFKGDKLVLLLLTSRTYELKEKFTAESDASTIKSLVQDKYKDYQYLYVNNGKIVAFYDEVTMSAFFETPKTLQFGLAYADGNTFKNLLNQLNIR